jgi:hypothetical protein
MQQYLHHIKLITDQLAATPVDDDDILIHTLNGLPDDYRPLATPIRMRARTESITLEELHDMLIGEELCMQEDKSMQAPATALTANRAPYNNNRNIQKVIYLIHVLQSRNECTKISNHLHDQTVGICLCFYTTARIEVTFYYHGI